MSARAPATKAACDGCRIRKIRCRDGHPCQGCRNSHIKCTYRRVQQPRGPRCLRVATQYLIDQVQCEVEAQPSQDPILSSECQGTGITTQVPAMGRSNDRQSERFPIPTDVLACPLYIFHMRMYPVWPIVNVESLMSFYQRVTGDVDLETYALATAVAAATIAQLRLEQSFLLDKSINADTFATESMRARRLCGNGSAVNLNNVRTSFFLHIYHESKHPGGSESLLYLREAISLAQMMHLHRETSYIRLPPGEKQIRRRVLWLLFVTERLPAVLKTNISMPELDFNDEPQILPGFLKLLDLFRLFEQSKVFDFIEDDNIEMCSISGKSIDKSYFDMLHDGRQDGPDLMGHIPDVQKADLCVTRHWMRMILWNISVKNHQSFPSQWPESPSFPVIIAKELLNILSQLPQAAIEAHGLGMELKLVTIANSVSEAVTNLAMLSRAPVWNDESCPRNVLARLYSLLSSLRSGGDNEVAKSSCKRMTEAQYRADLGMPSTIYAPMRNSHLLGATASRSTVIEEESLFPDSDYITSMPNWHEGKESQAATFPTGPDLLMQNKIDSTEEQTDRATFLDDMLVHGFSESCFSSANHGYPAFSDDARFIECIQP